ncbi:hypothetical protein ACWOFR_00915 [Carnobacterium gallinarum]|uniref:hypothetical protein n=1 Tax=Carnobacterium gallinarum TaxID=2749 RepID=UPI000B174254|nr:hypothetical protein [Carnobacterium gallinarum]
MNVFKAFFSLMLNNWDMIAIFLLSVAVVSTGMMQSSQKKELDILEKKIKLLEEKEKSI